MALWAITGSTAMRNEACPLSSLVAVTCWLIAASIIVINASTAYETLSPLVHSAAYLHAGERSGAAVVCDAVPWSTPPTACCRWSIPRPPCTLVRGARPLVSLPLPPLHRLHSPVQGLWGPMPVFG